MLGWAELISVANAWGSILQTVTESKFKDQTLQEKNKAWNEYSNAVLREHALLNLCMSIPISSLRV